jgi:hypothetical protein
MTIDIHDIAEFVMDAEECEENPRVTPVTISLSVELG